MEIENDEDEDDCQLQLFYFPVNKAGCPGSVWTKFRLVIRSWVEDVHTTKMTKGEVGSVNTQTDRQNRCHI